MTTILFYFILLLAIYAPVFLVARVAEKNFRKDPSPVLLVGLFTGWLGALIVALVLPARTDAQIAGELLKREARRAERLGDTSRVVLYGLGFCSLILLAAVAALKLLV